MDNVVRRNRECCEDMDWVDRRTWESSGDRWGLPEFCFNDINKRLSDEVSYTDVIVFLILKYHLRDYLEIGVSVLKNFYQVACNTYANIIAVDINPKNPYVQLPRAFKYIQANVLNKNEWNPLKELNIKHDIIFSDALHHHDGLQAEWDYYIKDHLAEKFIIIWDDAYGSPLGYIKDNFLPQLRVKYGEIYTRLMTVQEWVCNRRHPIFIVSNIDFNLN